MKKEFSRFSVKLLIFSMILAAVAYVADLLIPGKFLTPSLPWLLIFFFVFTGVVHLILLKASAKDGRKFFNYFMIATFLKFIVYISLIFGYLFINKEDIIPFVIAFFALYILYTAFEVVAIVKYQK